MATAKSKSEPQKCSRYQKRAHWMYFPAAKRTERKKGTKAERRQFKDRRNVPPSAIKRLYRTRPKCDRIAQFLAIKRWQLDPAWSVGMNTYLTCVIRPRNGRMATKILPLFGVMMMLLRWFAESTNLAKSRNLEVQIICSIFNLYTYIGASACTLLHFTVQRAGRNR